MVYGKLIVGLFEDLMHGWFGVETTYYFYFKIIIIFVQSIFLFLFLFFYFYVLIDLQNHCIIDYNVFNTCVDMQTYDHLFIQRWLSEGQQTCPQTQR